MTQQGLTAGFQLFHNEQPVRNCGGMTIYPTSEQAIKAQRRMRRLHGWRCEIREWSAS